MEIFRVLLTPHDFFFYVSREYGRVGITENIISNYALMYALNDESFSRLASGTKPHYEEDIKRFSVYATPARPYSGSALIGEKKIPWSWEDPVWISYNALDSTLLFTMEKDKIIKRKYNVPKVGTYLKHPPLNTFEFFIIGSPKKKVIRIGKKLSPARIRLFKCEDIKIKSGRFTPSHPVNYMDIKEKTNIIRGRFLTIPPVPLILDAVLEGEYIECRFVNERGYKTKAIIALPDKNQYPGVFHE